MPVMVTIGDAFKGMQHGTIEIISDWLEDTDELRQIDRLGEQIQAIDGVATPSSAS